MPGDDKQSGLIERLDKDEKAGDQGQNAPGDVLTYFQEDAPVSEANQNHCNNRSRTSGRAQVEAKSRSYEQGRGSERKTDEREPPLRPKLDSIGGAMDLRAKGFERQDVQANVGCGNRGKRRQQK